MSLNKPIFEELFDGPKSVFGRVFGRYYTGHHTATASTRLRVQLTPELIRDLQQGKILTFEADGTLIEIMRKQEPK